MKLAARFVSLVLAVGASAGPLAAASGWLAWRGPGQDGISTAKQALPTDLKLGGPNHRWSFKARGAGTAVIADGRVYAMAYFGVNEEVEEAVVCLDVKTGAKLWEHRFLDFLSDTTYDRYAIGAPSVDAQTGNVYVQSTAGEAVAFDRDGKQLWTHSLQEEFGRLTFPNGRTGAPAIDGDLVIYNVVTSNWGGDGAARNRFYAFDKRSGDLVWTSTPGEAPVDNSFALPVFANLGDQRVFYVGIGCGHVVCVNARTGEPVWRFKLSLAGLNSQVALVGNDRLIAIHGKENIDSSTQGRMVSLKIPTTYPTGPKPVVLGPDAEAWRNDDFIAFTSSPLVVDNRVYSTGATGFFTCADATTGKTLWQEKLGADQIHASPAYADGRFYVPMHEAKVYVIAVKDDKPTIVSTNAMEPGTACLGAPSFYGDAVLIFTKDALHCFAPKSATPVIPAPQAAPAPEAASTQPIAQLQVVPSEFALLPGQSQALKVFGLDAAGRRVREVTSEVTLAKFVPPTALVKSEIDAEIAGNVIKSTAASKMSAGQIQAKLGNIAGVSRGRVVAGPGYKENFEAAPLGQKSETGEDVGFPPLAWLGARVKWYVFAKDGAKFVGNRLDSMLFMRTMNFIGHPDSKNYTLEADVMTDGNRRIMSNVGLVNQRYLINVAANNRILEVTSNHERLKASVPFEAAPNTWYRLKTRVDADKSGPGGTVRAKVWPKAEAEPAQWTIEVKVPKVHAHGAPGVFAFSPQSLRRVFIDNLSITANE
jgi:outer membrane protein assembly factor BamB